MLKETYSNYADLSFSLFQFTTHTTTNLPSLSKVPLSSSLCLNMSRVRNQKDTSASCGSYLETSVEAVCQLLGAAVGVPELVHADRDFVSLRMVIVNVIRVEEITKAEIKKQKNRY